MKNAITMKADPQKARRKPVGGRCRICGCTDLEGCPDGCAWSDREHTLCSICHHMIDELKDYLEGCYAVSRASLMRLFREAQP